MANRSEPDDAARDQRDAANTDRSPRPGETPSREPVPGKGTLLERDLVGQGRGAPSKVGQHTEIEKQQRDGTTHAAGTLDEAAALLGVDLRLSRYEIKFPSTAVEAQIGPLSVEAHNRGTTPARVDGLVPISGDGDQFNAEGVNADIAAGGSAELGISFRPTRRGPHRANFHLRAGGSDVPHQHVEVRGSGHVARPDEAVESASDNRIAIVRAGGAVPPPITFEDMLASLRAAQQVTDEGAAQDAEHGRVDYDRAGALVDPVEARLDGLMPSFIDFARQQGLARTTATSSFEGAQTAVKNWARRLRGDSTINAAPWVTAFAQAKEIIQVLTGEAKEAPTVTALGHAARWTPLEIVGAGAAGGIVGAGGAALVGAVVEAGATSPSVVTIANTVASEWQNARYAFAILSTWVATHPDEANELATWLGSIGFTIVDAGGVEEFFNQIQDWESFLNILGQMAEPVVNHEQSTSGRRTVETDPMGVEPTTFSTGPRGRGSNDERADEPNTGARRSPGAGETEPAPSSGTARVLARVRSLIDRVKGIAGRARGAATTPEPEPAPSSAVSNASKTSALPTSVDEARARRAAGEHWSNKEIRDHYNAQNGAIPALNQEWIRQGLPAEQRARLAFEHRHTMRMTGREMMGEPARQLELLVRDAQKYGDGEGPTFDQLVAQQRTNGKEGDAAYEAIISGAEKTDAATNARVNKGEDAPVAIDLPPGVTIHGDSVTILSMNGRAYDARIRRGGSGQVETKRNPDGTFDIRVDEHAPAQVSLRQVARSLHEIAETPRQGSDDLDHLYADAAVAQRELGDLTRAVAGDLQGRALVPEKLKGRERTQEKINADYEGENARITDLARSTIEFDKPQQVEQAIKEIGARAEIVRIKDRFKAPLDGYRDVLMNLRMSNGHIVEMQLHLKAILDVKNGPGHPLYEEIRTIDARAKTENRPRTPAEEEQRQALVKEMTALYDQAYEGSQHQEDAHGN